MGGSQESFRKRFRRLTVRTATDYRAAYRINQACVLIQEGRLRDAQIADLLEFYDAAHFSKCFKKLMGIAPRTFRGQLPATRIFS